MKIIRLEFGLFSKTFQPVAHLEKSGKNPGKDANLFSKTLYQKYYMVGACHSFKYQNQNKQLNIYRPENIAEGG